MATEKTPEQQEYRVPKPHTHGEEAGAIAGEVAGAVVGSMGGPAGAVAGMVLGAAAGAMVGKILDEEAERVSLHDEVLDEEIGVTSGDLGSVPPPPPRADAGGGEKTAVAGAGRG